MQQPLTPRAPTSLALVHRQTIVTERYLVALEAHGDSPTAENERRLDNARAALLEVAAEIRKKR
jgi:hypothetical protein